MKINAASAALALALGASPAGAATVYGDAAAYLAAGNVLTDLDHYAPPFATVPYPGGFSEAGVTITGPDLEGIGTSRGTPEHLTADGSMTLTFPTAHDFAFNLWAPGVWRITLPDAEGSFGFSTGDRGAAFVGMSDPTAFDAITITSCNPNYPTCNPSGPVNLLTTPPRDVPEPSSLALLGVGLLGLALSPLLPDC